MNEYARKREKGRDHTLRNEPGPAKWVPESIDPDELVRRKRKFWESLPAELQQHIRENPIPEFWGQGVEIFDWRYDHD